VLSTRCSPICLLASFWGLQAAPLSILRLLPAGCLLLSDLCYSFFLVAIFCLLGGLLYTIYSLLSAALVRVYVYVSVRLRTFARVCVCVCVFVRVRVCVCV
jgi:hypothetical protein